MATYQFSALADGQAISFDPNVDVLNFDQPAIGAADLRFTMEGVNLRIEVARGNLAGKDIMLQNVSQLQLANSNVNFADASRLLVGDNTPSTANDGANNSLLGSTGRDYLAGFGGADTLNGGMGNDTYFVTAGDVLIDSGGHEEVYSDAAWTLGTGFEDLYLLGTANINATGNGSNNVIVGNAGNNYFNGRGGSDTILGGAGNDTVDMSSGGTGLQGNDAISGGAGIDTIDYDGYAQSGLVVFFSATSGGSVLGGGTGGEGAASIDGFERFVGGAFGDQITGAGGAQYIDGRGGDDTVSGGEGADTLIGGAGTDAFLFTQVLGSADADSISDFVSGSEKLLFDNHAYQVGAVGAFSAGDARFWASASGTAHDADDRVLYNTNTRQVFYDADGNGGGAATLVATLQAGATLAATDIAVTGTSGGTGQYLVGTPGNDTLVGGDGDDTIEGLAGNDDLQGGDGADSILGGTGNDTLRAQSSDWDGAADTLDGGLGDDVYWVSSDGDVIAPDVGGVDTVIAVVSDWTLGAGLENLDLFDDVGTGLNGTGNALDNVIRSATEGGTLRGLSGNDTLILRHAQNTASAYGGDGNDTIQSGWNGNLFGEAGNDLLASTGNFSAMNGGDGNDRLQDADGDADLDGGAGNDTLTGGAGWDAFYFTAAPTAANADLITDFAPDDMIWLDSAVMAALGSSGSFGESDGRFYAAAGATGGHDADDRVVYNASTGQLFYDADGSGSGAAQLVATLQAGAVVAVTDIGVKGPANPDLNLQGGSGNDSLSGGFGNDTIRGGTGNDTLNGGAGNDSLVGEAGADSMIGGDGQDELDGWDGAGGDTLEGGFGGDTYYVDAGDFTQADAGGEDDVVFASGTWMLAAGFEVLRLDRAGNVDADGTGNELNNMIWGGNGANRLVGGGGSDFIVGGLGIDTLSGGEGNDELQGSRDGAVDYYLFDVAPGAANADDIVAFDVGEKIVLDATVHANLGASGNFAASDARFWSSTTGIAHDATDRVIYNTSTGDIWYDVDGNGAAAAQLIANVDWGAIPSLTATDFMVVNGTPQEGINGTAGDDSLTGTTGNDTINGLDGNDTIDGGAGDDTLQGGAGDDLFVVSHVGGASSGYDRIDGGAGLDRIAFTGAEGPVQINAAAGNLAGPNPGDSGTLTSVEVFSLTVYDDWFIGDASANTVVGMGGNDTLGGGAGNDFLTGDQGNDYLSGGDGNDTIDGGADVDTMDGGAGDDRYFVTAGDVLSDSGGNDSVSSDGNWTLATGLETLILLGTGNWQANGNNGNSVLTGNSGNNYFNARGGSDTIVGGAGNDTIDMSTGGTSLQGSDSIDGGSGIDTVDYDGYAVSPVNVNLQAGTVSGGGLEGTGSATLAGIERVVGGSVNDTFFGWTGADQFEGRGGNDTLNGGAGADTLVGGAGADAFVFSNLPGAANADRVTDFASGTDKVHLDDAVMTALGAAGNFTAGDVRYWEAAGATSGHDANDRVVYNTSNGNLYYDADGSGSGAAQLIATLQGAPGFTDTDVFVI